MKIINGLPRRGAFRNPVVTIGNFDGVHAGHQKIFRELVKKADEINGTPVVITFCPHPMTVVSPGREFKQITTFEVKCSIAKSLGIKALVCIPFNKELAAMDSETFIRDILVNRVGAKWVIVGNNCSFGRGKTGSPALLRRRGRKYGFQLKVVRYATALGKRVSSTRVRGLVSKGDVCEAALTLGRAYHIEGLVVRGTGRGGPMLHTPTANIETENSLIPREGVYAARVTIDPASGTSLGAARHKTFDSVANIGTNPTFGEGRMAYEVHLLDFNADLVGHLLRIHFIKRIRDEKKFKNPDELTKKIAKDIEKARAILKKKKPPLYF